MRYRDDDALGLASTDALAQLRGGSACRIRSGRWHWSRGKWLIVQLPGYADAYADMDAPAGVPFETDSPSRTPPWLACDE